MITQTLAVNGAKVYIVGRTEEKLETVVDVYGKNIPGQIIPIVGDVSTKVGVQFVEAFHSPLIDFNNTIGNFLKTSNHVKNASAS